MGPRDRRADPQRDRVAGHAHRSRSSASWPATRASTASATSPASPSPPTSPGRRSRGCSTTSTARASARRTASCCSAPSTRWVLWNLTGGKDGGIHITDVTNASRTLLMDLETLDWHEPALDLMGVPRSMLPEIKSSSEEYGEAKGSAIGGRPLSGILGDQQAALFGQTCFEPGDAKNTYGTGSFLLVNTGEEVVRTDDLLTTVGYKLGDGKPHLRAGGLDRGHRRADPVAARPPRDHRGGARRRGARQDRRRQRRRLLRARLLRPVRPALARRRPRRDRRASPATRPRATSRARRSRRPRGSPRRSSTPPTRSPTSRSTSCASTAA